MSEKTRSESQESSPPQKRSRTMEEMVETMRKVKRKIAKDRVEKRKARVDASMSKWRDDLTENERIMGLIFMILYYDGESDTPGDMLCRVIEAHPPTDDAEKLDDICKDVKEALFTAVNNFLCLQQPSE